MAKHPTEIIQQNTERAMEAADVSLHWFRQATEQNFKQSKAAVEELIELTRRMTGEIGIQASAFCVHSMSLAEETLSNTFDCGSKLLRLRDLQELARVQTDLVSRQAQAIADQTKELNERFAKGAEVLENTFTESRRRRSNASTRRQSKASRRSQSKAA
jgi:hypothetical protein